MDEVWLVPIGVIVLVAVIGFFVLVLRGPSTKQPYTDSQGPPFRMSTDGHDGNPTLSTASRARREHDSLNRTTDPEGYMPYGAHRRI